MQLLCNPSAELEFLKTLAELQGLNRGSGAIQVELGVRESESERESDW